MKSLSIDVTLETPDGNPWPLLNVVDHDHEAGLSTVVADGLRVPCLGPRLDEWLLRLVRVWRALGPLAAIQLCQAADAERTWPGLRRRPGSSTT